MASTGEVLVIDPFPFHRREQPEYTWDPKRVTISLRRPVVAHALFAGAKKAIIDAPNVRAVIRADCTVRHGRVIRVLDLLEEQAGISNIAFGVSPVTRRGRTLI